MEQANEILDRIKGGVDTLLNEPATKAGKRTAPAPDGPDPITGKWPALPPAPLTMGRVAVAVFLGNLATGILIAIIYAMLFVK